jgi:subtilisin family serine protease
VDVAAPGGALAPPGNLRILSTKPGDEYILLSGTSQATAHVTGAIALALQLKPKLTFEEARGLLQRTAFQLPCCNEKQQGAGLIAVEKMIEILMQELQ